MELEDLKLLLEVVKTNKDINEQDKDRLETKLALMLDYYISKEDMLFAKQNFEEISKGKSVIKLD